MRILILAFILAVFPANAQISHGGRPITAPVDLSPYQLKSQMPNMSTYATTANLATVQALIPSIAGLATTTQLTAVQASIPSLTGYATTSALNTVQALIPSAGSAVPVEMVGGSAGTTTSAFMRADAKPARITRATTVSTITGGTFSGTWTTALGSAPTLVLTPIATGGTSVHCELTAVPTTTTFAGRCVTLTVASIVAVGAGQQVQVIALPPTQ